ncbi:hypothetical protein BC629DRAFT_1591713 [Irpex lacteus]|nr:hypothetical protein BC629DRAFT_1591713 [Irpex lacteus]
MRSFTITTSIVFLAVTSTFAAPLNSTLHFFDKRDSVCGTDFRALVDKASCIPTGVQFALTPPSAVNEVKLTGDELTKGPKDAQCDHLVELQLLDFVAKQSGLCDIIAALTKADPTQKKADLLAKASKDISALKNLNFLNQDVNNRKKTVIQRSLKGSKQGDADLDKAVGNFLKLVGSDGTAVAQTLDADLLAIKTTAEASLAKLNQDAQKKATPAPPTKPTKGGVTKPPPKGGVSKPTKGKPTKPTKGKVTKPRAPTRPSRDPAAAARTDLDNKIKAFKSQITVTEEWKKVLAAAPHT